MDAAVKALSICEEGQHHQDDEQAPRMVDAMVHDPGFSDVGRSRQLQYGHHVTAAVITKIKSK